MSEPASTPETITQAAGPQSAFTLQQMFDDLGGYEEMAVAARFGGDIASMGGTSPTKFARALIFVDLRRRGSSDSAAYKAAQDMKLGAVTVYFADEPEAEPDEPQDSSDQGKDD